VQEPETKRPFGTIIHKREDYFKLVLGATEFEGMNGIYQSQGSVQWQVKESSGVIKDNFLTGCAVIFSKMTLHLPNYF
jgi:hypothetical protein